MTTYDKKLIYDVKLYKVQSSLSKFFIVVNSSTDTFDIKKNNNNIENLCYFIFELLDFIYKCKIVIIDMNTINEKKN